MDIRGPCATTSDDKGFIGDMLVSTSQQKDRRKKNALCHHFLPFFVHE